MLDRNLQEKKDVKVCFAQLVAFKVSYCDSFPRLVANMKDGSVICVFYNCCVSDFTRLNMETALIS